MKQKSAKRTKLVNNIIVHIVLAVLAAVWVFPVLWVIMTSFRAEKGSYVSSFFPKSYTLDNYVKRFTDTTLLNFPQDVHEHPGDCHLLLPAEHLPAAECQLLPEPDALQDA